MMTYTYPISNTANNKVSIDSLESEIQSSAIKVAVQQIDLAGSNFQVTFKATLAPEDETILNSLVAAHTGEPLADNVALPVIVEPTGGTSKRLLIIGLDDTCNPSTTTDLILPIVADTFLQGGRVEVANFDSDDALDITVEHPLAGTIAAYSSNLKLGPFGYIDVASEGAASIPAGLSIRLRYTATATAGIRKIYLKLRTWV